MRTLSNIPYILAYLILLINPYINGQNIALMPNSGPLEGLTVLKIYGPTINNQNYSTYPTPKCRFSVDGSEAVASWIHCIPLDILQSIYRGDNKQDPQATITCLTCMTPSSYAEGAFNVDVTLLGDYSDKLTTQFTYYLNPTITSITPILGQMAGGTFVQVFGQNFKDVGAQLQCAFGTIYSPARFINSQTISCYSPSSDVVDVAIPFKVTQNMQQNTMSRVYFYYYPFPEISELIPNRGPNTGGTLVYLTGKMLYPFKVSELDITNTTFVKFGDIYISNVTLINNTHASVTSPPSYLDIPVPVELTFNQQEWTENGVLFYYYRPPYVFQLIPNSGTTKGGTNVTVIGANFYYNPNSTCKFNNSITPAYYIDQNTYWCITPASQNPGYVSFGLALEADEYSGNNLQYLYVDPPIITSVGPTCGPTFGLTQLTVIGKNFISTSINNAFCVFNGTIYQPATIVNSTLMYCDSPSVLDKFGNNYNNTSSYTFGITLNNVDIISYNQPFNYYTLPLVSSIIPNSGPITGGTLVTIITNMNITTNPNTNCPLNGRFGTMQTSCNLVNITAVQCIAPKASCPDDTAVQVSLNGQQYSPNDNTNINTLYSYYKPPIVSYIAPSLVPNTGSTIATIYGRGLLYGRNDSTGYNGIQPVSYFCRYSNANGVVFNVTTALRVDDTSLDCMIPPNTGDLSKPVSVAISTNGQDWFPVSNNTLSYYQAPIVTSIDPQFGPIKTKGTTLMVYGSGFQCLDPSCALLACAFSTSNYQIVTQGTLINSGQIECQIPPVSRPEQMTVSITLNGNDYTTQNIQYTFFDAFILSLNPSIVPIEGGTLVQVNGYGFANTQQITVRFGDNNNALTCPSSGSSSCIISANYVNESQITFIMPPQTNLNYVYGSNVGFIPFEVEVSVYGDSYTNNNLTLQYYQQPQLFPINPDSSPYTFHSNSGNTVLIPIQLNIPPGMDPDSFTKKLDPACNYNTLQESFTVLGNLINYPLPNGNRAYGSAIACPTPPFTSTGSGNVSISINGGNFVGNQSIIVQEPLSVTSISPSCGPVYGGTPVQIQTQGFDPSTDLGNLFFIWGSQCTAPLPTSALLSNDNSISSTTLSTITPAAPNGNSDGGISMLIFGSGYNTQMSDYTNISNVLPHIYSRNDFLYYSPPVIQSVSPHSGIYTGGTLITIQGAYFFNDPAHGCTPKCKFGNAIVEATYLSTVQLTCITPSYAPGTVSLEVSMNGIDFTTSGSQFIFYPSPVITDIYPKTGPSTGGTIIIVSGTNFTDLSRYPSEFLCIFRSLNLNIPLKMTTAYYKNSSAILCTTPGGWGAGNIANVEITYNSIDITNSNATFRFYQVDNVTPISGPSSGDMNPITISGSGFVNVTGINCKIDGIISNAINVTWTMIQCPIPPAKKGVGFFGTVDFFYTLNGKEYAMVVDGFSYYLQPVVSSIQPNIFPAGGGTIIVNGNGFRNDFSGAAPTCKLANTIGTATVVNSAKLICNFGRLNYIYGVSNPTQFLSISLNNLSYTTPTNDNSTLVSIFDITSTNPTSGVVIGGTLVSVNGYGFVLGAIPLCRFGWSGSSLVTYGTVLTNENIRCNSPGIPLPANGKVPFDMPISISFIEDDYDVYTKSPIFFRYYTQPQILDINPKYGPADHNVLVTVTSDQTLNFAQALVGGLEGAEGNLITENILCDFGSFGSASGIYIDKTTIQCLTPQSKIPIDQISEESVAFRLAINGQDYIFSGIDYSFRGTKSLGGSALIWIIGIIIGVLILIGLLYLLSKLYSQSGDYVLQGQDRPPMPRVSYEPRDAEVLGIGGRPMAPEPGLNARIYGVEGFELQNSNSRP